MQSPTPLGEAVRLLRIRYAITLKSMANHMQISPSYLSGLEHGLKYLSQKNMEGIVSFFIDKANIKPCELEVLKKVVDQSKTELKATDLPSGAKEIVASLARHLQSGKPLQDWANIHATKIGNQSEVGQVIQAVLTVPEAEKLVLEADLEKFLEGLL